MNANQQARPETQSAPRRHRSRLFIVLVLVIAFIAVAGAIGYYATRKKAPPLAIKIPVNVGHPVFHDFPIRVSAVGTVQPINVIDMKVRVDGQLKRIAFNEGQEVVRGELIAELDQGPLTAQLQQAEATQQKDAASLANAKRDFARYEQLATIGAATTQALDTAKSQVAALTATVAADAAVVRSNQLQLSFTKLYAPFNGRVGAKEADLGAIVHPSDATGIVTLTQMAPINVTFSIPQDSLPIVQAQQKLGPLDVAATNHADNSNLANGRLVFIDSAVDATTGQIKMKGLFDNTDRKLWPGQLVNTRILVRTEMHQLAVPARAVVNGNQGTAIFVIDAKGDAQIKSIKTGVTVDGMIQIQSGLTPSDTVVFDGQSRLNPGVAVQATQVAATQDAGASNSGDLANE